MVKDIYSTFLIVTFIIANYIIVISLFPSRKLKKCFHESKHKSSLLPIYKRLPFINFTEFPDFGNK